MATMLYTRGISAGMTWLVWAVTASAAPATCWEFSSADNHNPQEIFTERKAEGEAELLKSQYDFVWGLTAFRRPAGIGGIAGGQLELTGRCLGLWPVSANVQLLWHQVAIQPEVASLYLEYYSHEAIPHWDLGERGGSTLHSAPLVSFSARDVYNQPEHFDSFQWFGVPVLHGGPHYDFFGGYVAFTADEVKGIPYFSKIVLSFESAHPQEIPLNVSIGYLGLAFSSLLVASVRRRSRK